VIIKLSWTQKLCEFSFVTE